MIFSFKKNIEKICIVIRSLNFKIPLSSDSGIRILTYHSIGGSPKDHRQAVRVPVEEFKRQMEFLADYVYKTYTVSELIGNRISQNPEHSIILTFDDGYKDNITVVAPLLKKLGFSATFFINVSYADGAVKKKWRNGMPREYMNWDDVLRLSEMGFEIGSHMVHHTNLTVLNDNELNFEFTNSRDTISKNINKPIEVFSCPYGKINQRVIQVAKDTGYIAGCSSFRGVNNLYTDKYILRRTEIDGFDTISDFKHKLGGFYD